MKSIFIAGFLLILSSSANAFMSIAVQTDTSSTYVCYDQSTPQEAKDCAQAWCDKIGGNCEVKKYNFSGTVGLALAIARGDHGVAWSTKEDPKAAADSAISTCKKSYGKCRLTMIAWDSGDFGGALALGEDSFFMRSNADTRDVSIEDAMNGCKKKSSKPESCHILEGSVSDTHAWYASASSKQLQGKTQGKTITGDRPRFHAS